MCIPVYVYIKDAPLIVLYNGFNISFYQTGNIYDMQTFPVDFKFFKYDLGRERTIAYDVECALLFFSEIMRIS